MSEQEREEMLTIMSDNFDYQSLPKLGIFWYDPHKDELFGVTKIEAMDVPFVNDKALRKTVRSLHKDWWKKQEMRLKAGREKNHIFGHDYTKIPRGRLFQRRDEVFEVMCGSWMTPHIMDLVIEEFDLQKQTVEPVIDEHWELGHGWSEEIID
ncbi:hypothetical protein FACS1894182_03670 [Bacteroidia bacterium]|nr:hypothetical protein FACS1894182_03670 [Bacteroidia bacterium]